MIWASRRHPRGTKILPKSLLAALGLHLSHIWLLMSRSWLLLERSWAVLGRHLGRKKAPNPNKTYCFVNSHFFEDKTVRRGFWDQLGPTKSQNEPNMTPKREPKTTPRRSKIDIKIDQKNDAKTKRAVPVLACRLWAGNQTHKS